MDKTHPIRQKFSGFTLHPKVVEALEKEEFRSCTPIQALALPLTLVGRDVVGQAQTGTRKTMAFLTSTFHYLLSHPAIAGRKVNQPCVLIMTPTRELAAQVHADARPLVEATGLRLGLAYGGDGYDRQLKVLESGVDILIDTTGRLIDYVKQNHISLGAIQMVVLDEANRMYDLGFIKDIRWLFRRMPPTNQRLDMLFFAAPSYRIREPVFEQMNNAEYIEVGPEQRTGHRTKEELFYPSDEEEIRLLQTLIEEEWPDRAIILTNAKHRCERIWGHPAADSHHIGLLTGDVVQRKRLRILDELIRGDLGILVAIDVTVHGLHIPAVTHVFNCDLPDDCEDHIHRIGRIGRAGAGDHSISLAYEEYVLNLPVVETYIGHSIPVNRYSLNVLMIDLPEPLRLTHPRTDNDPRRAGAPCNRRYSGQRKNVILQITQVVSRWQENEP